MCSDYKWSTHAILAIQTIAVEVGVMARHLDGSLPSIPSAQRVGPKASELSTNQRVIGLRDLENGKKAPWQCKSGTQNAKTC